MNMRAINWWRYQWTWVEFFGDRRRRLHAVTRRDLRPGMEWATVCGTRARAEIGRVAGFEGEGPRTCKHCLEIVDWRHEGPGS